VVEEGGRVGPKKREDVIPWGGVKGIVSQMRISCWNGRGKGRCPDSVKGVREKESAVRANEGTSKVDDFD